MKKLMKRAVAMMLAALLLCGSLSAFAAEGTGSSASQSAASATSYEKFEALLEVFVENHIAGRDTERVLKETIKELLEKDPELFLELMDAMTSSGDEYSRYLTNEMWTELNTYKQYGGIGVTVAVVDSRVLVTEVMAGSAADEAGVKKGDCFVTVDGTDVSNLTLEAVTELVRGDVGKPVTLGLLRPSEGKTYQFTITRRELTSQTVYVQVLDDGAGYIRIVDFNGIGTYFEMVDAVTELEAEGVTNVIYDVRNNPGGDLLVVLNMIDYLVSQKDALICTLIGRDPATQKQEYRTTGKGTSFKNSVVLVNGNTISAAELFAVALQELGVATVVGTTTYGKAVGQTYFEVADGSALAVTTFEILSPKGEHYNTLGVRPNITVENPLLPVQLPKMEFFNHGNYTQAVSGSVNKVVLALEQRLVTMGYLMTADETFSSDTEQALRLYQKNAGLTVTGKLDLKTFQSISDTINVLKTYKTEQDDQLAAARKYLAEKSVAPAA